MTERHATLLTSEALGAVLSRSLLDDGWRLEPAGRLDLLVVEPSAADRPEDCGETAVEVVLGVQARLPALRAASGTVVLVAPTGLARGPVACPGTAVLAAALDTTAALLAAELAPLVGCHLIARCDEPPEVTAQALSWLATGPVRTGITVDLAAAARRTLIGPELPPPLTTARSR